MRNMKREENFIRESSLSYTVIKLRKIMRFLIKIMITKLVVNKISR
jgi:hypothetical protein